MIKKISILLILTLTGFFHLMAQQGVDTLHYRIETRDGNVFTGTIAGEDSLKIILTTRDLGEVYIPKASIRRKVTIEPHKVHNNQVYYENPQSGRYFWAPGGYGLRKGEGYYQNIWVLWNQASYGLSKYFSVGAGMIPLFLFGSEETPLWIVPKFSAPIIKDKLNIGAGGLVGVLAGEGVGFGILYGTATYGSRDHNVSFGMGIAYADGEWADNPIINFSGMTRVSPSTYLVTENYFLPFFDEGLIISFGGRTLVRRIGIDYALAVPMGAGMDVRAIPILGFTVPF